MKKLLILFMLVMFLPLVGCGANKIENSHLTKLLVVCENHGGISDILIYRNDEYVDVTCNDKSHFYTFYSSIEDEFIATSSGRLLGVTQGVVLRLQGYNTSNVWTNLYFDSVNDKLKLNYR